MYTRQFYLPASDPPMPLMLLYNFMFILGFNNNMNGIPEKGVVLFRLFKIRVFRDGTVLCLGFVSGYSGVRTVYEVMARQDEPWEPGRHITVTRGNLLHYFTNLL